MSMNQYRLDKVRESSSESEVDDDDDTDGILDSEDEHPLDPENKSDPFPWRILSVVLLIGGLLLSVYKVKEKKKRYEGEGENTQTPSTDDKELSQQE